MTFHSKHSSAYSTANGICLILLGLGLQLVTGACQSKETNMNTESDSNTLLEIEEVQLTNEEKGHFLNQRQAFSPDDRLLVLDNRNDDSKIGENASIQVLDIKKKELKTVYHLDNQSQFGPGVGAVSFHPSEQKIVFIHGLKDANQNKPYDLTRRFGMELNLESGKATPLETRDVVEPYTPGSLRGGSHAYSYSADGHWISYTYNDEVLAHQATQDSTIQDLRTVGVFWNGNHAKLQGTTDAANFQGTSLAFLIAEVTPQPKAGSDEIKKAYEECWVGVTGYRKSNGNSQQRAVAYLGDVVNEAGELVTEVFISDLPDTAQEIEKYLDGGSKTHLPSIPPAIKQRRLTYTSESKYPGVFGPRQWLRSSPDGSAIYFYKRDIHGIVQVFSIAPTGGEIKQVTFNSFSPETSFALSFDGKYLAYGASENIYVTDVSEGITHLILGAKSSQTHLSNINWSNSGYQLAYNRKVGASNESYYQVFFLDLSKSFKNR